MLRKAGTRETARPGWSGKDDRSPMLTIAICDDDTVLSEKLSGQLRRLLPAEKLEIMPFSSAGSFAVALEGGYCPDIAFVDIELNGENGIGFVKRAFPPHSVTQVIYITAYLEYSSDVYETEHIYFLHKPVAEDYLRRALDRALANRQEQRTLSFLIAGETVCFTLDEILFVESSYRVVTLHTSRGKYALYARLQQVREEIDAPMLFYQCHKSFLVNFSQVASMESKRFIMKNREDVPISRDRTKATREAFFRYLGDHL